MKLSNWRGIVKRSIGIEKLKFATIYSALRSRKRRPGSNGRMTMKAADAVQGSSNALEIAKVTSPAYLAFLAISLKPLGEVHAASPPPISTQSLRMATPWKRRQASEGGIWSGGYVLINSRGNRWDSWWICSGQDRTSAWCCRWWNTGTTRAARTARSANGDWGFRMFSGSSTTSGMHQMTEINYKLPLSATTWVS